MVGRLDGDEVLARDQIRLHVERRQDGPIVAAADLFPVDPDDELVVRRDLEGRRGDGLVDGQRTAEVAGRRRRVGERVALVEPDPLGGGGLRLGLGEDERQDDQAEERREQEVAARHDREPREGWRGNGVIQAEGRGESKVIATQKNKVTIDIRDTGTGIPKFKWETIFQPGYTTRKRGWGLGLSLTRRIIDGYHKGDIFVKESEVGKGTTFRIILQAA